MVAEDNMPADFFEDDAADVERRRKAEAEAHKQAELKKRSQVNCNLCLLSSQGFFFKASFD